MKALVICDDEDALQKIRAHLLSRGVEAAAYRWFLKALDNIEEIEPDFAIINASEYPRHWKTLAQYLKSGAVKKPCGLVLYAPAKLSAEEEKKADALDVAGTLGSCEEDELKKLDAIIQGGAPGAEKSAETATEKSGAQPGEGRKENGAGAQAADGRNAAAGAKIKIDAPAVAENGFNKIDALIFTHPKSGAFVTGNVVSADAGLVEFKADVPALASGLGAEMRVALSYRREGKCESGSATIAKAGDSMLLKLD